jgi:hypothetical protein
MAMSDTLLAWMVSGALVLAVLAVYSFRLVPADERLVRFRRGRRGHEVKGPGLVVVVPGIDRGVRVPLRKAWADVMWLEATTRDGVPVTVNGAALVSVLDPGRYALAAESPDSATVDALESEMGRYVAERDLVELSGSAVGQDGELTSRVNARTGEWGVEVAHVELSRIEVRLGAQLIRWAEGLSARTSPAARQLRWSACSAAAPPDPATARGRHPRSGTAARTTECTPSASMTTSAREPSPNSRLIQSAGTALFTTSSRSARWTV